MRLISPILAIAIISVFTCNCFSKDVELYGIKLPEKRVIAGKVLKLNGAAGKKVFWVKVCVGGLYLEHPTKDANEVIESEQVKCVYTQYLTDKATAQRIQKGFIELLEKNNSIELVDAHRDDIKKFVSWFDKDMVPGQTVIIIYEPGVGLTLEYMGDVKGTIPDPEFAEMYFRYTTKRKVDIF